MSASYLFETGTIDLTGQQQAVRSAYSKLRAREIYARVRAGVAGPHEVAATWDNRNQRKSETKSNICKACSPRKHKHTHTIRLEL